MIHKIGLLLTLSLLSAASTDPKPNRAMTEINFDNQLVDGKSESPLGSVVEGVGNSASDTIIDLREDFTDKLVEDAGGNLP